jgi:hypothetical protein
VRADKAIMKMENIDIGITTLAIKAGFSVRYTPVKGMDALVYQFSKNVDGKEFALNKALPMYEIDHFRSTNNLAGYCKMVVEEVRDEFKSRGLG